MKPFRNRRGFRAFEMLLVILALGTLGVVSYLAYQAQTKKTDRSTETSPMPSASVQVAPQSSSSTDLIVAAVKTKQLRKADGTLEPVVSVHVDSTVDSNAKGVASSNGAPSGFIFIAHKGNDGKWVIVYEGQELPGKAVGMQYGLPTSWYSQNY